MKVKGGWVVKGHSGRRLSKVLKSRTGAVKRLKQVEWFKHHKGK